MKSLGLKDAFLDDSACAWVPTSVLLGVNQMRRDKTNPVNPFLMSLGSSIIPLCREESHTCGGTRRDQHRPQWCGLVPASTLKYFVADCVLILHLNLGLPSAASDISFMRRFRSLVP